MKENFTLRFRNNGLIFGHDNSYNYGNTGKFILSVIIAFIIVFPITRFSTIASIMSFILLFFIIYIIINSMTSENLSNELPSTLYPSLPHMGLDGISANSYMAGMTNNKY